MRHKLNIKHIYYCAIHCPIAAGQSQKSSFVISNMTNFFDHFKWIFLTHVKQYKRQVSNILSCTGAFAWDFDYSLL